MTREPTSESVLSSNAIASENPYAIPLRLRGRVGVGVLPQTLVRRIDFPHPPRSASVATSPASGRGEASPLLTDRSNQKPPAPYSFEITSFSDNEATIEARMIADTAERPNT